MGVAKEQTSRCTGIKQRTQVKEKGTGVGWGGQETMCSTINLYLCFVLTLLSFNTFSLFRFCCSFCVVKVTLTYSNLQLQTGTWGGGGGSLGSGRKVAYGA